MTELLLKAETYDVGVIVGRFQVPELHDAHRALIRTVMERHDKVILVLGMSPVGPTANNPLDFQARSQMIFEEFPGLIVTSIKDLPSDAAWSARLDGIVADLVTPSQTVVLYGSRDSFLDHYSGRFSKAELLQESYVSGTQIRKKITSGSTFNSAAFRAGVVWGASCKYPTCYVAVDIAVFDYMQDGSILLARKSTDPANEWRFIGGFLDPTKGTCLEDNARREVAEEASGIEIGDLKYVSSQLVDDWRYRNEADKIMSVLFKARYLHGAPKPADDICELKWFKLTDVTESTFVPSHRPLWGSLTKSGT